MERQKTQPNTKRRSVLAAGGAGASARALSPLTIHAATHPVAPLSGAAGDPTLPACSRFPEPWP